ncbi:MAG: LysR family transcriptional regulator [Solobacterium sp.]|nr:LysR family transcriptional regulator [Solobacterium sp.]
MELRVLRYFIQVARDESITKAAKTLHISQPSLSKQIKDLEEELGVKLFTRSNYSIRLTEDGIRLRLRAEDIVSMADQTIEEFVKKDQKISGDIRIGAAEGEAVRLLGRCMHQLKEDYPEIHYHLYSGDTEMLKEKLDNGFLDFLLIAEDPDQIKYHSMHLPIPDEWGLIMLKDDELSRKKSIKKEDLIDLPLIISRQAFHQDLVHLFGEDAHRMYIIATYDLAHNASLLVQEGFGYLLAFHHIADLSPDTNLIFRPISPVLYTDMHLIYRKYQIFSPQAEVFLHALQDLLVQDNTEEKG